MSQDPIDPFAGTLQSVPALTQAIRDAFTRHSGGKIAATSADFNAVSSFIRHIPHAQRAEAMEALVADMVQSRLAADSEN